METDQTPSLNPPQTSGMAVASLITGIIGAAPLAIIFGHIAMSQIRKSAGQLTGFGLALAGTILGYVGLAVIILLLPSRSYSSVQEHGKRDRIALHAF